ncbi:MAG: hypothetical protein EPN80_05775 [Pandoraea sp.]|nr:MAG: hypothetical protein EPN80_05775 [Pandoraea sp.]TAM17104.1 MAG: hypothetical protein EPN65_12575 [Pandoraea sp.]
MEQKRSSIFRHDCNESQSAYHLHNAATFQKEIQCRVSQPATARQCTRSSPLAPGGTTNRNRPDGGWNATTPFPFIQGTDCCGEVVGLRPGGGKKPESVGD